MAEKVTTPGALRDLDRLAIDALAHATNDGHQRSGGPLEPVEHCGYA